MKPLNYVTLQSAPQSVRILSAQVLMAIATFAIAFLSIIPIILSIIPPVSAQYRPGEPGFFGDGEDSLEREIDRLNQTPNDDRLLVVDDPNSPWVVVTSPEGKFSVSLPGTPTPKPPEMLATRGGNLTLHGLTLQENTGWFLVAYADYPETSEIDNPQERLLQVRDAIASQFPDVAISEQNLTIEGYPGREMRWQSPTGETAFRMYLVERRLYLLGATRAANVPVESIMQFFESFRASDR